MLKEDSSEPPPSCICDPTAQIRETQHEAIGLGAFDHSARSADEVRLPDLELPATILWGPFTI